MFDFFFIIMFWIINISLMGILITTVFYLIRLQFGSALKYFVGGIVTLILECTLVSVFLFGGSPKKFACFYSQYVVYRCDRAINDVAVNETLKTSLRWVSKQGLKISENIIGCSGNNPEPIDPEPIYNIEINSNNDFKKVLELKVTKSKTVNKNPLRVKLTISIKNKSLWWLDIHSKQGNYNGTIDFIGLPPGETKQGEIFIKDNEIDQISFYGFAGDTYTKNAFNSLWVGATGGSCNDMNNVIETLVSIFGSRLLSYLKDNPQIIVKALVDANFFENQTTMAQFIQIQSILVNLEHLGNIYDMVKELLSKTGQIKGLEEWFIISKKQEATIKIVQN